MCKVLILKGGTMRARKVEVFGKVWWRWHHYNRNNKDLLRALSCRHRMADQNG